MFPQDGRITELQLQIMGLHFKSAAGPFLGSYFDYLNHLCGIYKSLAK